MIYRHLPVELVCRLRPNCPASFTNDLGTTLPTSSWIGSTWWMQPTRSELRELNELNYARFDAKLEQRITELRAEMQLGFAKMDARFIGVDSKLAQLETRLTKRLLAFWVVQAATTVGLVLGVVKLLS